MNMFKPTKAKTVKEYIDSLPKDRKEEIMKIHKLIQATVPKLKTNFTTNMIGYGLFPYKSYKGGMMEWPVVSLASQKNYISVYVCAVDSKGKYVAEAHQKELGKVSVGKSCIRFKKLEDVDLPTLKKVLKIAEKNPGLISAAQKKKK